MSFINKPFLKTLLYIIIFVAAIVLVYFAYTSLLGKYRPDESNLKNPIINTANKDDDTDEKIKAPNFVVYNQNGDKVNFSDFIGKPVVINFWTTWCPYCKDEMQDFNDVYLEVKDDVYFMMINQTDGERETKKKADDYIKAKNFEFPVYYDFDFSASTVYSIQYLPTTVFIDADGNYVAGYSGPVSKDTLRSHIDKLKK